jgi:hypothetical protein
MMHPLFMMVYLSTRILICPCPQYRQSVAAYLQGAGYRTGFFGKYLNQYGEQFACLPPGHSRG